MITAVVLVADNVVFADGTLERGKAIYAAQCAKCHGNSGQGVATKYEKPLAGNSSVEQLVEVITDTMPEDDAGACVGEDAVAVASYIHGRFYNGTPRKKLARLTGTQLSQSLADLFSHFTNIASVNEQRGLHGEYFEESGTRKDKRKIERIDPKVDFDFEDSGPGEGISADNFAIQWIGGLKADVSGEYEIVVRSTCAFVFYLGDHRRLFIDNHVQSGDKTEFRRSITLTAGRVYPLKIIFYQRKRKTEQPPAQIKLSWVTPFAPEQVIPTHNLLPELLPSAWPLQTKLPPDDRSYGYERGIAVDRQWDDSTTAAAIEFGHIAAAELWPRFERSHRNISDTNRARLRAFLKELVETAFRGPIDESLQSLYVDSQVDPAADDAEAIRRCVLITLKSPRFLYPLVDEERSPSIRAANRLALTLFDSLPSESWLVGQARSGHFDREVRIRTAARRMADDYRTQGKMREMMYAWLNLDHISDINKNSELFPDFNADLVGDLRTSLDLFLDEVIWSETSDYRRLMLADWSFTNERLHQYYGDNWKPARKGGWQKSVASSERAGVVTHPYLMTGLAYADSKSPIHRGVFVIRYMLGRTLRPPEEAFTPLSPKLHPDLTTRERIALQTSPKNCQVCHAKINALGFTLENFDAVGRYRVNENGREMETTGAYTTRKGKLIRINGPHELAKFLATSEDAHRAFVDRMFEHFVKQPAAAYGPDTLDKLTRSFQTSNFNIRELLIEIAVVAANDPVASSRNPK